MRPHHHSLLALGSLGLGSLVFVVAGCGGTAPSAARSTAAAAPRNLVPLARRVERDDAEQVIKLTFLASSVTDDELRELANLSGLRELTLQECQQITDEGLAPLKELSALKTLKLIQVPVSDAGLAHLSGTAALEELLLGHTDVTGTGLAHLAGAPFKRLVIFSNVATAEGLSALAKLTDLTHLELHCAHIKVEDLPSFALLTNLESLVLTRTPLGPTGLARIEGLPRLKRLVLDAQDVDDEQLAILSTLGELDELELTGARATDAGLSRLVLPKLKALSLADCTQITDAGLHNLSGLSSLETLNLAGSSVAGKDLLGLAALRTLRTVLISGAQFKGNDQTIDTLKERLPNCEVVILRG